MANDLQIWTLGSIADRIGGRVFGNAGVEIAEPVPADAGGELGITFAENGRYLEQALGTDVAAIIVPIGTGPLERPTVEVDRPRVAFFTVLQLFSRPLRSRPGVHPTTIVHPSATVDPTASIGPYTVLGEGAVVSANVIVESHCAIGDGCAIGERSVLRAHVTLYEGVSIGKRVLIHSGAVLGADGFGFQWDGLAQRKIPQVGRLVIGDDCEIGANACIDRATCGASVIGEGVKLDNLIHIGHNANVGSHTVMAALVGVSGSVKIGSRVTIGGQAGVADHVSIPDDVILAGRTGVTGTIDEPGAYSGMPADPVGRARRIMVLQRKLPELYDRVKVLETELRRLQGDG